MKITECIAIGGHTVVPFFAIQKVNILLNFYSQYTSGYFAYGYGRGYEYVPPWARLLGPLESRR